MVSQWHVFSVFVLGWCGLWERSSGRKLRWADEFSLPKPEPQRLSTWCSLPESEPQHHPTWCSLPEPELQHHPTWCSLPEPEPQHQLTWCSLSEPEKLDKWFDIKPFSVNLFWPWNPWQLTSHRVELLVPIILHISRVYLSVLSLFKTFVLHTLHDFCIPKLRWYKVLTCLSTDTWVDIKRLSGNLFSLWNLLCGKWLTIE